MLLPPDLRVALALLLSLAASPASAGPACAAPPLNLPYRNVSVTPGVLTQGIPLELGMPWQRVVLMPSLQLDGTYIPRYGNACVADGGGMARNNNTSEKRGIGGLWQRDAAPGLFDDGSRGDAAVRCGEVYGGAFEPSLSGTFKDTGSNDQIAEWWLKNQGYRDWHYVTERWRFGDYLEVYTSTNGEVPEEKKSNLTSNFELADAGKSFGGLGSALLGLTPEASLLKDLLDADVVPSTSWALTNESLCLGCVDASTSSGDFQIFKPADRTKDGQLPCLIQAKVEVLNWHPKADVEGATLIEKAFTACIDPGVKFLVLPNDARDAFKKIVARDIQDEYEDYMVFKGPPKDDVGLVTVKLEGGLQVNITVPGAGKAGAEEKGNWRVAIGKGGWGAYGNQTFVLGKPFTDQIVLRWDSDKQEYGLANLNTAVDRKTDLQPLGCDHFPKAPHSGGTKSMANTGVLIGSVLGAFVGGLLVALGLLYFFRRGRKTALSKYEPLGDTVPMQTIPSDRRTVDSWMSGALSPPPPSMRGTPGLVYRDQAHSRAGSRTGERDRLGTGVSIDSQTGSGTSGARGLGVRNVNAVPVMADDTAVFESSNRELYEAPEGGTAYPTKRERLEIWSPPLRPESGSV